MRINCPCCGERSLDEFVYHGDATVRRPDPNAADALAQFAAYAFQRTNPHGTHRELWYHSAGCHAWLVVTRVVATHKIIAVELARDVAGQRRSETREVA